MDIVNLFYELARQHKMIRGFQYGKAYEKGAGNEIHPLMWLDDPIMGRSVNQTVQYTVNVDILGIPETAEDVVGIQNAAFQVGLTVAEKIKTSRTNTGFFASDFTFITLRDYYDNNAAGCRFTYTMIQANPVDRCNDDFDPDKQLPTLPGLPDFATDNPEGCATFADSSALPNFKLDNKRGCAEFP